MIRTPGRPLAPLARILASAKLYQRLRQPGAPADPQGEATLSRIKVGGHSFAELVAAA